LRGNACYRLEQAIEESGRNLGQQLALEAWNLEVYIRKNRKGIGDILSWQRENKIRES